MFDTVLIAGLGLMGGSMAKTIKARTLSRVLGWNRTRATAEQAADAADAAAEAQAEVADAAEPAFAIPDLPAFDVDYGTWGIEHADGTVREFDVATGAFK